MNGQQIRLCLLVVFAFLTSCKGPVSGSRAISSDPFIPVRVAVGGQSLLIHSVTALAAELGFFRDEGLAVQLQDTQGSSKAML